MAGSYVLMELHREKWTPKIDQMPQPCRHAAAGKRGAFRMRGCRTKYNCSYGKSDWESAEESKFSVLQITWISWACAVQRAFVQFEGVIRIVLHCAAPSCDQNSIITPP